MSFSKTDVFYIVNEECSPQTDFDESAQNSLEKLRCIHCSSFSSGSNNTLVGRSLIHTPNLPSTCNVLMFNITKHVFLKSFAVLDKHTENRLLFIQLLEHAIPPLLLCCPLRHKKQTLSHLPVFCKHGQLDFSKATDYF